MGFIDKIGDVAHANSNDPDELYERGMGYYDAMDYEDASDWFIKAAKLGHRDAQYRIGVMYNIGEGVPQIEDEAIEWLEKAAAQGHPGAMANLGVTYMNGKNKDPEKSFNYLKQAYDLGIRDISFFLGECYLYGDGTEKDPEKAIEILKVAADFVLEYTDFPEDNYQAPLLLGDLYYDGEVVEHDEDEAARWYEIAADRGCDEAVDRLVEMGRREKPAKKKGLFGRLFG